MFHNMAVCDGVARQARRRISIVASIAIAAFFACSTATAEVLLKADFSDDAWYRAWQDNANLQSLKSEPDRTSRIAGDSQTAGFEPHDGPALQVLIPKGQNMGTGLSFYPRTVLGRDPNQLYLRYYLRFGSDWNHAQNGKLPGFGGTYDIGGWGGTPSNGTNGWSARGKFGDPCSNGKISMASYVYHADMSGSYGDGFSWTDGCANGLERNRWYAIEYYVHVNTPGQSNGILRGWIDGRQVMERTGLRFDDTGQFQIERIWIDIYHGGKTVAPQDMHVFLDDIVVSDQPIGMTNPPTTSNKPTPPTDVAVN